jgi:hypothetical protein
MSKGTMKAPINKQFAATKYSLSIESHGSSVSIVIHGKKLPPPSKRITLNQKGLKVISAKIVSIDKKNQESDVLVSRINHIKSFEEVRLHTNETLYPGNYIIKMKFLVNSSIAEKLKSLQISDNKAWREYFPCIDDIDSRQHAETKIKVQ